MKKVLILAHDFPPFISAGANRPYAWYLYFKEFGLEPIIITRNWRDEFNNYKNGLPKNKVDKESNDLGTIIKVPFQPNLRDRLLSKFGFHRFKILRKFFSLFYAVVIFKAPAFDSLIAIKKEAKKYLQNNQVDLIIATGEPFILFNYARDLSSEFNIPFALDYRDNWSNGPHAQNLKGIKELIRGFYERIEKNIIKKADFIITAAPVYKEFLIKLGALDNKTHVVFNGYFDNSFNIKDDQNKDVFTIAYAGWIHGFQKLETFLEGYKQFILNYPGINTKVIFYGLNYFPDQIERLRSYDKDLNEYLFTTDKVPQEEILLNLKRASVLLLLANPANEALASKVFDYIYAQRRILLVLNDNGILKDILEATSSGFICNNAHEVTEYLSLMYEEFKINGYVSSVSKNYEDFSRRNQTRKLAEIIKQCVA